MNIILNHETYKINVGSRTLTSGKQNNLNVTR